MVSLPVVGVSGRDQFAGSKSGPLALLQGETFTANDIVLEAKVVLLDDAIALNPHLGGHDIGIDTGIDGFKVRVFGEVGLLMLSLDCMVGGAAIDVEAVNANTHLLKPSALWTDLMGN